jgi:hypothetical protein
MMTQAHWVKPWRFSRDIRHQVYVEIREIGLGSAEQCHAFIAHAEEALTLYYMDEGVDLDLERARIEAVLKAAQNMQDALQRLDEDASNLLEQGMAGQDVLRWLPPRYWRDDATELVKLIADGANWALEATRPRRTGPKTGGSDAQLVADLAVAFWRSSGERPKPSGKKNSKFGKTLAAVLTKVGIPVPGERRLKRILRGVYYEDKRLHIRG